MKQKTFSEHFKFAMDSMGLPLPPPTFYATSGSVAGWITAMSAFFTDYGTKMTMAEFYAAVKGTSGAVFANAGTKTYFAGGAAFYAGAIIGSFVYAIGQHTSEHLWIVKDEVYKKPYIIVNTKYRDLVKSKKLQNYLKHDFPRQLQMKCIAVH